jgi:hypothetical protein
VERVWFRLGRLRRICRSPIPNRLRSAMGVKQQLTRRRDGEDEPGTAADGNVRCQPALSVASPARSPLRPVRWSSYGRSSCGDRGSADTSGQGNLRITVKRAQEATATAHQTAPGGERIQQPEQHHCRQRRQHRNVAELVNASSRAIRTMIRSGRKLSSPAHSLSTSPAGPSGCNLGCPSYRCPAQWSARLEYR